MALPNESERKLIHQLRYSCKDILNEADSDSSDMFLVRWLRAKDCNMKRAEQMLRENRRWRKLYKVNRILDNGLDTFFKINYPLHMGMLDKRGRPVVVLPIGEWNFKVAIKNGMRHRFHTFAIQCIEAIMKSVENRNFSRKPCAMPVTQFTLIVDFAQFHCSQLFDIKVLRYIHHLLTTLEANYPETLANCICINCPLLLSKSLQYLLLTNSVLTSSASRSKRIHWVHGNRQLWEDLLGKLILDKDIPICMQILHRENAFEDSLIYTK